MLPAWATVLVALGASAVGGIFGALLTTQLRIRHERDEQRRARLTDAADDFLAALGAGRVALSGIQRHLRTGRPGLDEWVREAGEQVDTATARVPRVALLFGDGSDAAVAASAAVSLARTLLETMREEELDWQYIGNDFRRLVEVQSAFNRAAGNVIEHPEFARASPSEPPQSLDDALSRLGVG